MVDLIAPGWLSEEGMHTLSSGYLLPGETPRKMFQRVAKAAAVINEDESLFDDLFTCLWNGWLGLASPVAANFGTSRALPISCYSVHLSDSVSSIYSHLKEVAQLSKNGGGVGVYFGDVRPAGAPITGGGRSTGVVPWCQQYDLAARVVSQGGVRRGSFAIYLPIDHPDVPELLRAKDHSKGDPRKFVDSNVALTISDEWVESMIAGDTYKQELFGEVLKTRMISGSPYLVFIDNANAQNPECYVDRGLSVKTSNLCSEIFLHTDEQHSFVCVLSSLNLSRYDEFKNWVSPVTGRTVPQIAIHLLDAVVTEFIRKAKDKVGLGRSVRFAEKSRALGLGTMGLHTLYQKRGLPFKSSQARGLNIETHQWIRNESETASRELATRFGEPEWCAGSGLRHTHFLAVAPTRTNSVISGAFSQGIEPIDSNYFVAKQAKGTYVRKNPVLEQLLCERGVDESIWEQILEAKGSVQDLECLTDWEKEVFQTAREIDQFELVKQAADRQPFICQGQSLNLFVDPESDPAYIMRLHLSAWKNGLKSLYYLKSSSLLTKKTVVPALVVTKADCPWCDKLKDALRTEGITYEEISKQEAVDKGYWNPEWKTVPQMWLYKKHIGGYTDYVNLKHNLQNPHMKPARRVRPKMSRRRYKKYPGLTPEQQNLVAEHKWISGRLAYGAKCQTGGHTGSLTREDLESIANFALCVAATRYRPDMNVKYSTYAWNTARGYIQHALRDYSRMVRTPRWIANYKNQVSELVREGKTYKEIAEILGLDELKVMHCELSTNNYHVSYDSSPEDWVTPEFVYNFDEHKATLLSPELVGHIRALSDAEMGMLMKYIEDTNSSEDEREWAAEKFFELQNIAHGTTGQFPDESLSD